MAESIEAWHFLRDDCRTYYKPGDVIVPGKTYKHKGRLRLCDSGLHASVNILDALDYAHGHVICRVRMSGDIIYGEDKLVASERTVLWMYNCEDVLREFARWCALEVVHLWDTPDIMVKYLKTGRDDLMIAAMAAAMDASTRNAARGAAAWASAARASDSTTAWASTRAAARSSSRAIRDASWASTMDAIRAKFNSKLESMIIRGNENANR